MKSTCSCFYLMKSEKLISEWYGNEKKPNSDWRKLLRERLEANAPQRRELTIEEQQRLSKLESIIETLMREENVQSGGCITHYLHTNYET